MEFAAGYGKTNVDLLFDKMPRLPDEGEEIYTDKFSLCIGGGVPGTMITLSRLGVPTRTVTELSDDMFSRFAKEEFHKAGVEPVNVFRAKILPLILLRRPLHPRTAPSFPTVTRKTLLMLRTFTMRLRVLRLLQCIQAFPRFMKGLKKRVQPLFLIQAFMMI